eukprot:scaffold13315_cov205-Alexandrium_tamarense.AAC.2
MCRCQEHFIGELIEEKPLLVFGIVSSRVVDVVSIVPLTDVDCGDVDVPNSTICDAFVVDCNACCFFVLPSNVKNTAFEMTLFGIELHGSSNNPSPNTPTRSILHNLLFMSPPSPSLVVVSTSVVVD